VSKAAIRSCQGNAIFIPVCYIEEKPSGTEYMWVESQLDRDSI
jgi:hypothetical protein